ncbi:hypothetical protein HS99_0034525 [Kitasatospora aureofaciens]|uniref:Uncharacterized protein n=1 Tax=Kitasatospora aureofaciens TaxID=1894 RepID=A0A1E7N2Z6_KITAU|nr:hypothetical protein HS99_0034525 [Kitasatospora aureofaciens]
MPSSLFEPLWDQLSALFPKRPEFDPNHPLGCHELLLRGGQVVLVVLEPGDFFHGRTLAR